MKIKLIEEIIIPDNLKLNPKASKYDIESVVRELLDINLYLTITKNGIVKYGDTYMSIRGLDIQHIPVYFESSEKKGMYGKSFDCSNNKLISLEGCPERVDGSFHCNSNNLTTLEYSPNDVSADYDCSGNKLTSLRGCPKTVYRDFVCSWNNLYSLNSGPNVVKRHYECYNNPIDFTEEYVRRHCKVGADVET